MRLLTTRSDLADFLNNPKNVQMLDGLVEDIRHALMGYHVCVPKLLTLIIPNICLRHRYKGTSVKRAARRL